MVHVLEKKGVRRGRVGRYGSGCSVEVFECAGSVRGREGGSDVKEVKVVEELEDSVGGTGCLGGLSFHEVGGCFGWKGCRKLKRVGVAVFWERVEGEQWQRVGVRVES